MLRDEVPVVDASTFLCSLVVKKVACLPWRVRIWWYQEDGITNRQARGVYPDGLPDRSNPTVCIKPSGSKNVKIASLKGLCGSKNEPNKIQ